MSSCSPFQQATVQAICRHFETSNSALCADEAGLGKTFVARGVIGLLAQRHALKQCGERVIQDKIKQWWRQFGASVRGNSHAKERLPAFAKSVGLDEESVKGRGRIAGEARIASQVLDRLETLSGEELEQFCLALTMNLPYLLIQRGNRRRTAWDFSAWEDYPVEPLRVLYVCCNLAIAEQNTRKLVDLPQRSIRSLCYYNTNIFDIASVFSKIFDNLCKIQKIPLRNQFRPMNVFFDPHNLFYILPVESMYLSI